MHGEANTLRTRRQAALVADTSTYRTHPVHNVPDFEIRSGHAALAQRIRDYIEWARLHAQRPFIILDGYIGVEWDRFVSALQAELLASSVDASFFSTALCFLPQKRIDTLLESTLTSDPVFGRLYHGHLTDLWDATQVNRLRTDIAMESASPLVVYGFGASLLVDEGLVVYIDVPKDRAQQLAAEGNIVNVGMGEPTTFGSMYKRMYFVDWPMLNRIKRAMLPRLDVFVDGASSTEPYFVEGATFRRALHGLAQQPFRVKPWFAPGPWGGQWMKERFGLPADQPNYAWSFELIAPENGLLLGDYIEYLECSFDYLLWQETSAVLGERVAARYGSYFPIRFDYLDTMHGTNLSCQVHPRLDYIRAEFGEAITQDETYYIVTCEPDSQVFLGLRDDIDLQKFQADAMAARDSGIPFDIADHVHHMASHQHQLFLIPSGTVHCSGANNLVLEISATPYIYTFKIYDYLRTDLSGQLRHVHLDHAFANIDATRTAEWVNNRLCPEPILLRQTESGAVEYRLGDLDLLFFAIHRLEFTTEIADETAGTFLALNLVEGDRCEVVVDGQEPKELHFAESMVIPASVGFFRLRNTGNRPCKVVKAFVK